MWILILVGPWTGALAALNFSSHMKSRDITCPTYLMGGED